MEKLKLTKEERELYLKIIERGTMDDMLDLGYAIGRARLAAESLERLDRL